MPTGLGDEKLWLCPTLDNVTPFNDLSGQANNGTAVGGLSTVADTSNGGAFAYDFDGTGDYISNSSLSLAGLTEFSFSGWINASGSPDLRGIFSHGGNTDYNNDIYILNNHGNFNAEVNNGVGGNGAVAKVAQNTWNHISVVFDGSGATNADRLRYFVNGVEVTLTYNYTVPSSTSSASPAHIEIGAFATFGGVHFWLGKMDDIRVFTRAINQSEIDYLSTARGITGSPPQGLGDEQMWLCPSINNSPNDISGHGNNGVYQGGLGTIADTSNGGSLAYDLDGTDDYIDCGDILEFTGPFSVSYWVLNDTTDKAMYYSNGHWDGQSEGYVSRFDGGATGLVWFYGHKNGTYGTSVQNPFTVSQWACVTNVYTGTHWEIYFDGVLVSQTAETRAPVHNSNGLFIGATSVSGWNVDGRMDDIRFFERALTQAEITHLASQRGVLGTPFEGLGDEQLWLCPSLQDGTNDLSGNDNDGVFLGSAATVADVAEGGSRAYNTPSAGDLVKCVYQGTDSFSGWFYTSAANRGGSTAMFTGTNAYASGGWSDALYFSGTSVFAKRGDGAADTTTIPSVSVPAGAWFHYASVRTDAGMSYYVDGVNVAAAVTSTVDSSDLFVGNPTGSSPTGDFRSDDIRAYTRKLTQAEITHLATSRGIQGPATPATLSTRYYDFGTEVSPVKAGYQKVTNAAYDANLFGWGFTETAGVAVSALDRGFFADDMETDFCYTNVPRMFRDPTVVAGDYTIKAYCGDNNVQSLHVEVWNGGTWVATPIQITNPSGTMQTATANITVGENAVAGLYVRCRTSGTSNWVICGLDLTPASTPTTGFYNPFINKIFNNDYTRRIR